MTGPGTESRIDTAALERAVTISGQVGDRLGASSASVSELDDLVRAGCGGRSAPGGALGEFGWLRERMAQTDRSADEVRRSVLEADVSSLSSAAASPWLDPNTDSLVVGIARIASADSLSRAQLDRVRALLTGLGDSSSHNELTLPYQARLAVSDPKRFLDNWRRAGDGAVDASLSSLATMVGVAATITPGADDVAESIFGQRPGDRLRDGVAQGLHQAIFDPDELAGAMLGVEEYQADPYRWFGSMAPDLALEALTAAVPTSGVRVLRRLPSPPEVPRRLVVRPQRQFSAASLAGAPSKPGRLPDLEAFRRSESDWAPSEAIVTRRQAPFESPEAWAADLNGPGAEIPGRSNNCIDCTRATEANWRGQDAVAAPMNDPAAPGVPADRLENWSGGRMEPSTLDDVEQRLTELGPGSSAMIASAWERGGAHAFNAVNDGGVVKWVDGQLGEVAVWPPPYADAVELSLTMWFDADGHPR